MPAECPDVPAESQRCLKSAAIPIRRVVTPVHSLLDSLRFLVIHNSVTVASNSFTAASNSVTAASNSVTVASTFFDWFEERIEGQSLVDDSGTKYVPPHIGLFYCLGGIVLMGFVVQFASGLLLTFYFTPTVIDACSSVHLLELWAHDGWFYRSLHRWASNFILLAILLHSSRVSLAGGFRKPRELTWISGAFLALLALAFGVSGYSLPWDQVGFWALQIVSAVPEILDDLFPGPGVGIVVGIRGGFSVGQETLSRTFTAHTLALPAGVSILSLCHFLLIRKQGVSGPL